MDPQITLTQRRIHHTTLAVCLYVGMCCTTVIALDAGLGIVAGLLWVVVAAQFVLAWFGGMVAWRLWRLGTADKREQGIR